MCADRIRCGLPFFGETLTFAALPATLMVPAPLGVLPPRWAQIPLDHPTPRRAVVRSLVKRSLDDAAAGRLFPPDRKLAATAAFERDLGRLAEQAADGGGLDLYLF